LARKKKKKKGRLKRRVIVGGAVLGGAAAAAVLLKRRRDKARREREKAARGLNLKKLVRVPTLTLAENLEAILLPRGKSISKREAGLRSTRLLQGARQSAINIRKRLGLK